MSGNLHPDAAKDMLDTDSGALKSESERALERATGRPAQKTGKASSEIGKAKLEHAAEPNDADGQSADKH